MLPLPLLISDDKKYRLKRVFMVCFYVGLWWGQGTWEPSFKPLLLPVITDWTALLGIRVITHENCPELRCIRSCIPEWIHEGHGTHCDQILNTWPWKIDICTKSGDNSNILMMSHWEELGPAAPGTRHEGRGWGQSGVLWRHWNIVPGSVQRICRAKEFQMHVNSSHNNTVVSSELFEPSLWRAGKCVESGS